MVSRNPRLLSEQRRRKILDLIEQKGQITVREISVGFSVSAVTARGDLDVLCEEGKAVRSHGGAVRKLDGRIPSSISQNRSSAHTSGRVGSRGSGRDSIAAGKDRTITFILGNRDIVNEFQSKVLLGAEGYLTRQDWALQFMSFRSDLNAPLSSLSLPDVLTQSNRPSGVILTGTHSANILAALTENRIPFSLVGNNVVGQWPAEQYDCVFTDDVSGAAEITRYLIAQGHRSIWYIGNQRLPWFAHCGRGYRQAMQEADLEPRFSEIGAEDRELGYLAVKSLLARGERPTALFAGTDQAASGVYQALQESGIRIPDDISVAGFNDTIGELLHPGLTTVREFPKELGVHLAEFTLRRISEPNLPPQQLIMPTELIRRESVRNIPPDHSFASPAALQENVL
ncbi:MAG: substrate-binding domain-containing protein [Candidatus Sulfotelmatobacter sp.]